MGNDRRRHRSPFAGEALRYYLEAVAARHGLRALTLADNQGLLVAAGEGPSSEKGGVDLELVGAVGVAAAMEKKHPLSPRRAEADDARACLPRDVQLSAAELQIREVPLYISALGGDVPAGEPLVGTIDRILNRSLPVRRDVASPSC